MNIPSRSRDVAFAVSLALIAGCGGSLRLESGRAEPNEANEATPSPSVGPGGETSRTPADPRLDAVCDGVAGLTGRSVLEQLGKVDGPVDGTFRRYVYPPGPPALDHETAATFRVRYDGGDVRCTPATPDPAGTPNGGVQPATVSLEATLDFVTADGLFAETFTAACQSAGESLLCRGDLPLEQVKGSFRTLSEGTDDVALDLQLDTSSPQHSQGGVVHGRPFGFFRAK